MENKMYKSKQIKSVALGSTLQIKIDAVQKVFPNAKIFTCDCSQDPEVLEQPFSQTQTLQGSLKRMLLAKRNFPDVEMWIGIQNGIWDPKNPDEAQKSYTGRVDGACVSIHYNKKYTFQWTDTIPVVEMLHNHKNDKIPKEKWTELQDPHRLVNGYFLNRVPKTREEYIIPAIERCFEELIQ